MPPAERSQWLGRVSYEFGLGLQQSYLDLLSEGRGEEDRLLLLEHEPVYTIGRGGDKSSLQPGGPGWKLLPHPVVETNRGGQATYHGPGQLVGYAVVDLKNRGRDLHRHLRAIEQLVAGVCGHFGVAASIRAGLTGVWVGERKLASIGVGVRRWISMHGFGLNVCGSLEAFNHITPCGLAGVKMTSLEEEGVSGVSVEEVAAVAAREFDQVFGAARPGTV
jgi:lipoyl(octanoyl) transferase